MPSALVPVTWPTRLGPPRKKVMGGWSPSSPDNGGRGGAMVMKKCDGAGAGAGHTPRP